MTLWEMTLISLGEFYFIQNYISILPLLCGIKLMIFFPPETLSSITASLMRVMSSKMGKPNFQKPSSSWPLTSVSSCLGHPFRWGIWPAAPHTLFFFWECRKCLFPHILQIIFLEQRLGALVFVRLPHAGLPGNGAPVCCPLWKTHPGQPRRQKFFTRAGGRSVSTVRSLCCCTGGFVGIYHSNPMIQSSRCAGNGGAAPAGASIPSKENEGRRPSRSPS